MGNPARKIEYLREEKKFGLVWEDKKENVAEQCKTNLPLLKEVKTKAIITDKNKPTNIIIEGDNYHALSVLNYTHAGKIDVIYIDPPYNTGKRDWKYNNDYVEVVAKLLSGNSDFIFFLKQSMRRRNKQIQKTSL